MIYICLAIESFIELFPVQCLCQVQFSSVQSRLEVEVEVEVEVEATS